MPTKTKTWEWPPYTHLTRQRLIAAILWELAEGGDVVDSSGRATIKLGTRLKRWHISVPQNMAKVFVDLETTYGRCIAREVNGRRTYAIRLLLDREKLPPRPTGVAEIDTDDYDEADEVEVDEVEVDEVEADEVDVPETPEEVDDDDWGEPFDDDGAFEILETPEPKAEHTVDRLLLIQSLATEVLMDVAQLAAATTQPAADEAALTRLAETLDENARLRRHLAEAKGVAVARANEAEMLRRSLRQVQANLDALRTGAMANDEGFRALDRIMREAPTRRDNGQLKSVRR